MCFECLLKEKGWEYSGLRESNKIHNHRSIKLFYSVLHNYLKNYGPHFKEELTDRIWESSAPALNAESLYVQKSFDDDFERLFAKTNLAKNRISSVTFESVVKRYFRGNYDLLEIEKEDRPRNKSSSITVRWGGLENEKIFYLSKSHLEDFLVNKCQHRVERLLSVRIPELKEREPKHSAK